jgi:hypothetical protein
MTTIPTTSTSGDGDQDLVPDFFTPAWLSEALHAEVTGFRAKRIGDGLVGMNLRLYLEGEPSLPATLVAKLPSPDPTSRATGIALRNYEREVMFYRYIADTLDIRVARCFAADWDAATGDFVLLLEDLAPGAQGNQLTGCSVDQARTAVLELARMHGPRWNDPLLHGHEWLSRRTGPDDAAQLAGLWAMLVPGFMATYAKYLEPDQIDLIERFGARITEWVDGRGDEMTVTHGDYRLDNLMFATPEGGYPVATVDWQSPGHGPCTGDLSYFIGAGLVEDDRRPVERSMVEEYVQALAEYDVEVDLEQIWHHYRRDTFAGVIMAVVASQVVGQSERSEALFSTMAMRHSRHALDHGALDLI